MFTERSEPIKVNAYYLLVSLFVVSFTGSVVCHTLPLFGKSTLGIISFDLFMILHSHSASAFLSGFVCFYSDPLHNQPSLESAMPRSRQYTDSMLSILCSFIKRDGSAHIYIHTYIYIQTLAQNRTTIIKISCLATLSNYVHVNGGKLQVQGV